MFSFWALSRLSLSRVLTGSDCGAFLSFNLSANWCWAHAIQFLGRLSFVFIGGLFGVVFFTRFEQLEFSIWKILFLLAVLFSLFCYTLDLDRLGKAFWEAQTDYRPRSP